MCALTRLAVSLCLAACGPTAAAAPAGARALPGGALLAALAAPLVSALPTGMEFVDLDGGEFTMGTDEPMGPYFDTTPAHSVYLSPFSISAYEVTNAQYLEFLNEALADGEVEFHNITEAEWVYPENEYGDYLVVSTAGTWEGRELLMLSGDDEDEPDPDNICHIDWDFDAEEFVLDDEAFADWPVVYLTWYGAAQFCDKYGLLLPTEAQWEFAAGAGAQPTWDYATDDGTLDETKANYEDNVGTPVDVGSYPANVNGLYDMSGNVHEWLLDWWGEDFYQACYDNGTVTDPLNTDGVEPDPLVAVGWFDTDFSNSTRMIRSGSYNYPSASLNVRYRQATYPFFGSVSHFGMRPVVALEVDDDDSVSDDGGGSSGLWKVAVGIVFGVLTVGAIAVATWQWRRGTWHAPPAMRKTPSSPAVSLMEEPHACGGTWDNVRKAVAESEGGASGGASGTA